MKNMLKINEKFITRVEKLETAMDFLTNTNFHKLEDGKIEIDGTEMWANLQTYQTKSNAHFEAHRKYIDLQYVIQGQEFIGVCDYSKCNEYTPYDETNDIEFLNCESSDGETMTTGDFLVLYPTDAHKPSISLDKNNPTTVRKLVIKIKIDD